MCSLGQTWDHVQIILTWILEAICTIKNILLIWFSMWQSIFALFSQVQNISYTRQISKMMKYLQT